MMVMDARLLVYLNIVCISISSKDIGIQYVVLQN